ncbi:hypothetical protein BFP72_04855 [Reichenbachiella sp. 5M10]|uniref:DUF4374 domain-containing protein n=1 Tax=Reichenbachiella sp. 5M10 TaxID=1889772 RepID=UPI000C154F02|nr:DUF4374 domain-containing protein [Reichenbachiella sp. 5M10]PIB34780.1 hypothetical protein BFP72_04855 [Reichenbachiella sp. 5M10]
MKKQIVNLAASVLSAAIVLTSCVEDDGASGSSGAEFIVGIEAESGTDVLVSSDDLSTGTITPIDNGIEQPAWMSFYQVGNTLLACGYSTDNLTTGYRMVNGVLTDVGSFITELGIYGVVEVDENTAILAGLTRSGYEDRIFYTIDLESMSITSRTYTRIDERQDEGLVAWPTGMRVLGDKFYVAYQLKGSGEDENVPASSTPNSDQARVAVYSYPEMEFEKIMTDDRTSDIGVYSGENALMETEDGDLYTYSTSALANGFYPTPDNPSGFLKIENGTTEFDDSYFFNFEEVSGGYKLNNAVYVGNGKAVVRMAKEDDTNQDYLWATYKPTIDPDLAICEMAVVDMEAKTFSKLDIPAHGGEWGMANLTKDGKVYVNISNADEAYIYVIDPTTATAQKGAKIEGNWTKGFAAL